MAQIYQRHLEIRHETMVISEETVDRRDLIKLSTLGLAACVITGCKGNNSKDKEACNIQPKQTETYKFSTALPFNYNLIEKLYLIKTSQ